MCRMQRDRSLKRTIALHDDGDKHVQEQANGQQRPHHEIEDSNVRLRGRGSFCKSVIHSYERKWIFKTNLFDEEGTRILHINIENAKQCIEDGAVLKTEIVQTMYATHVSSSNDARNMSQNFFRDNLMQSEIIDSVETNIGGYGDEQSEDENEDLRSERSPTPHSQRSDA